MIKNQSKNTILCKKKKILRSVLSRARGLMFSTKIKDTGYIFVFSSPKKVHLHMIFVFFPIDVIFLDEDRKVVEVKENFKPFSFYSSQKRAQHIMELPEGTIKRARIQVNDKIRY